MPSSPGREIAGERGAATPDDNARLRERVRALERELARRDAQLLPVFGESPAEVLERTGRLALLGTLAAGIAHELNGPIGSISVSSELGLAHLAKLPEAEPEVADLREILEQNLEAARRAGRVARDLLALARGGDEGRHRGDLNSAVESAVEQARRFCGDPEALHLELAPGSLWVRLNPGQVELVVINLVTNACDPEVGAGRVEVTTGIADGRAVVRVADDGRGVPESERQRIFEAFYTSRPGRGTGLGLSLARAIALAHGGEISLESPRAAGGAAFALSLPLDPPDRSA